MRSSFSLYVCFASALMASACQHNPWNNTDTIVTQGWANQGEAPPDIAPTHTPTAQNLYCYKSLAQVDCYTSPQPGKEHLRVGEGAPAVLPKETPTPASANDNADLPCTDDRVDVHKLPMVIHKDA